MMPHEAVEVTSLLERMSRVNERKENDVRKKMIKNLEKLVPRNSVGQRKYHQQQIEKLYPDDNTTPL